MKRRYLGFTRDGARVAAWARRHGWIGLTPVGRFGWIGWVER